MARHGDARSPSPVGGSYSSSKHSRRDDDRYSGSRRDDRRDYKHRSRSRSPDRRYRDRDSHRRRDRSTDRRNHDSYRSNRRAPSRDRKRSRERGDVRDNHQKSRDREPDRRDTSRDRDRKRRDDSANSRRHDRRRDSRDRTLEFFKDQPLTLAKSPKPATPAGPTDEEKKAERLARLEAWKKKQLETAAEKQKEQPVVSSTRSLLDEIDKKAAAVPTPDQASPQSPTTPVTPASPAPYAGKFDPKAIVKKAAANSVAAAKLGTDVALPTIPKASAPQNPSTAAGFKANKPLAPSNSVKGALGAPLKASGNLSGFGLSSKIGSEAEKPSAKRGLDLDEEEGSRKKLERLPTPPTDTSVLNDEAALANGAEEEDDDDDADVDLQGGTEEEAAAVARAAAEKREERLQAQSLAYQTNGDVDATTNGASQTNGDTTMADTVPEPGNVEEIQVEQEEEEVDPLDAYMTGLGDPTLLPSKGLKTTRKQVQEPVAMFGDEEVNMEATGNGNTDDILAMATKRKKKDMPTVNHAKVVYEPFRRGFYHEPTELSKLSEEEVADLRLHLEGIKVRGVDVPKPVVNWAQCGLGVQTSEVISKLNYETPSAIQSQAIPAIMSGRDVIGVAKTGSGKTVAFLLPMFRHIKDQRPLRSLDGPIGLIMTPTRELATQIHKDCKPFLKALNLSAVCAYGGAPIKDQIADLKRGAEIIVCTPGRMIDLLAANSGRVTNLHRVTYIVLDEADRMFDMGFEPQVMKLLNNIRPDRQTVLFSATFPRQMEALARKALSKPVEIVVGGRSVVAPEITQIVEVRPEETKFIRLLELLGNLYADEQNEDARTLIFVDRQESADSLLKDLMRKGYPCMSIHGGKDQIDRDSTIDDFKAGVVPIMIATSVAARGLDVKQLKLVVNYDTPNHLEDYVHRAGRTGRAGNTGTAVTFLTEEQDRYSLDIAKALKQSGQPVPEDVQNLVDSFMEKIKTGKEKASGGAGFGGKGLERLDQERDAARNRERKTYKAGDGDEEEEKEEKKGKDGDDDLFAKAASSVQAASAVPAPLLGVPKGIDLDGKIVVHKTETAAPAGRSGNPLDRVKEAIKNIENKLGKPGVPRPGVPIDNNGPDAGAFHATLEINDFPQKARWAVTNRTNVAKILDSTGTSITTKGSFYAAGKEPPPGGDPKLYILVEGDTEIVVTNAMRELMRLLKEGTIAAADSDARAPASGRYSVV